MTDMMKYPYIRAPKPKADVYEPYGKAPCSPFDAFMADGFDEWDNEGGRICPVVLEPRVVDGVAMPPRDIAR